MIQQQVDSGLSLLECFAKPAAIVTLAGTFVDINASYCRLLDYTREELVGRMRVADVTVKRQLKGEIEILSRIVRNGQIIEYEKEYIKKNGTTIPVLISIFPIMDICNKLEGFGGVVMEILEPSIMEKQLRLTEEHYWKLVRRLDRPIIVSNTDTGAIVEFSDEAHKYLNYSRKQFQKFGLFDLVTDSYIEELRDHIRTVICKGTDSRGIECLTTDNETIYVQLTSRSIFIFGRAFIESTWNGTKDLTFGESKEELWKQFKHFTKPTQANSQGITKGLNNERYPSTENITYYVRYLEERRLREELEQKLKRRTEFTSVLVHEMYGQLTPLLGNITLLDKRIGDEISQRLIGSINRIAISLGNRTKNLSYLVRAERNMLKIHPQPLDLSSLLHEVTECVRWDVEKKGLCLELEIPNSLPMVYADEDAIQIIVLNLLNNAIKFTSPGGIIVITLKVNKRQLFIQMKDTGCGISKGNQRLVFEPYHTATRRGSRYGLGLGLPLAKILIEMHNGQIWIYSQLGKGCTVEFSLPLIRQRCDPLTTQPR